MCLLAGGTGVINVVTVGCLSAVIGITGLSLTGIDKGMSKYASLRQSNNITSSLPLTLKGQCVQPYKFEMYYVMLFTYVIKLLT